MEKFSASTYFNIASQLTILSQAAKADLDRGERNLLSPEILKKFVTVLTNIQTSCAALGLTVSVRAVVFALHSMRNPSTVFSDLSHTIEQVSNSILWEMEDLHFFHMPTKQAEFYGQIEPFGREVNMKFLRVHYDMVEAGNCFAMGRSTACVFHLMRIMEVGVQEFGKKLGVNLATDKNWQNILDELNKAIRALPTKAHGTVDMSRAAANLYAVKLAWRNEVMHPNDTYTLEEAKNLIGQVKLFMEQLAAIV
jgi:hypothetical protein